MKKTPFYLKFLFALNFLLTFATIGVFVYTVTIYKKPLPEEVDEWNKMIAQMHQEELGIKNYQLPKMTVNIPSTVTKLRFLDLEAFFTPTKNRYLPLLTASKPIINDVIIEVASQFDPDELNSLTGKLLFEERVKKLVHERLKVTIIKQIYFTRFVVQ